GEGDVSRGGRRDGETGRNDFGGVSGRDEGVHGGDEVEVEIDVAGAENPAGGGVVEREGEGAVFDGEGSAVGGEGLLEGAVERRPPDDIGGEVESRGDAIDEGEAGTLDVFEGDEGFAGGGRADVDLVAEGVVVVGEVEDDHLRRDRQRL